MNINKLKLKKTKYKDKHKETIDLNINPSMMFGRVQVNLNEGTSINKVKSKPKLSDTNIK